MGRRYARRRWSRPSRRSTPSGRRPRPRKASAAHATTSLTVPKVPGRVRAPASGCARRRLRLGGTKPSLAEFAPGHGRRHRGAPAAPPHGPCPGPRAARRRAARRGECSCSKTPQVRPSNGRRASSAIPWPAMDPQRSTGNIDALQNVFSEVLRAVWTRSQARFAPVLSFCPRSLFLAGSGVRTAASMARGDVGRSSMRSETPVPVGRRLSNLALSDAVAGALVSGRTYRQGGRPPAEVMAPPRPRTGGELMPGVRGPLLDARLREPHVDCGTFGCNGRLKVFAPRLHRSLSGFARPPDAPPLGRGVPIPLTHGWRHPR